MYIHLWMWKFLFPTDEIGASSGIGSASQSFGVQYAALAYLYCFGHFAAVKKLIFVVLP